MIEIERKFLVRSDAYRQVAHSRMELVQAFLSRDPRRTVRVRQMGDRAWLTVKGATVAGGTTRAEWEYEIPYDEAGALLELCLPTPIRKLRFTVAMGAHVFEVDEFLDANHGLVLAEVELGHVSEPFQRPLWLGEEVTGQKKYYNSQLSINPFTTWNT